MVIFKQQLSLFLLHILLNMEFTAPVNQPIISSFVLLNRLVSDLFFSVNQPIFISKWIEPQFTRCSIDELHSLPEISLFIRSIFLDCSELKRESSSNQQSVSSVHEVRPYFFDNVSLEILVDRHFKSQPVWLRVFRIYIHFTFFIECGFFS